ncbi:MAG: hypothetical protein M0Q44_01220 [Methylobacter sp.]|nr:hypothetical protein [Methylobacter sp.]
MASGRILKTQISLSEQVNDLSLHAALLFTWMIPHADDFGRMVGNARKVKALVVPMRDDFTSVKVDECLNEIADMHLIERYDVNGEFFLKFPEWESHQSGLHKRTKSKLPAPTETEIPGNSGKFSVEQNRTELETETEITTVLPVDEKKIDPPVSGMFWVTFFVNEKGFRLHEAQTATTVPMFVDWAQRGVTYEDVELAMIAAHNKLGGGRPNNPTYYRNFVDSVMLEKQKSQLLHLPGRTGFQENLRGNYATKTNSSKTNTGVSGKPSLADQASQGVNRLRERKERERKEQDSVIN